jgi:lysine-N-methylase
MAGGIPRPRLALHVAARRHVVGGEVRVALHDLRADVGDEALLVVGDREWVVLGCADGTRDLDGIVAAVAARGRAVRRDHLAAFLAQLEARGLLAAGVAPDEATAGLDGGAAVAPDQLEEALASRRERPLDPLAGHALVCIRCGSCCAAFNTVLFSPLEALRARALCPEILDAGDTEEPLFAPERGAALVGPASARGVRVVTAVDGRCALLDAGGLCAVHDRGGAAAKPLGCRLFPRTFVDDGVMIRVSIAPECPGLFALRPTRRGEPDAEPLLRPGATAGADLGPGVHVRTLPERVAVATGAEAPRDAVVAWSRRLVASLAAGRAAPDAAAVFWALASALQASGPDPDAAEAAMERPDPLPEAGAARWVDAFGERVRRHGERLVRWRAPGDPTLLIVARVEQACARLRERPWPPFDELDEKGARDGAIYAAAVLHGHLAVDGRPLADSLRDRATRLLVARALPGPAPGPTAAVEHPLARVEALVRGQGLEPTP